MELFHCKRNPTLVKRWFSLYGCPIRNISCSPRTWQRRYRVQEDSCSRMRLISHALDVLTLRFSPNMGNLTAWYVVVEGYTCIPPWKQSEMVAIGNALLGGGVSLSAFCSLFLCCGYLIQNCFSKDDGGYVPVWSVWGLAVDELISFLPEPSRSWSLWSGTFLQREKYS